MKEIYSYLSPFIAAFAASLLTYFFTVRAMKHEVLMAQRIPAFKAIQKQLVSFRRYHIAILNKMNNNEFAPNIHDLPLADRISPIEQRAALDTVLADNLIFLSKRSRHCFDSLERSLEMLCNAALHNATEPGDKVRDALEDCHKTVLSRIDECIEEMYKELKLPE